MGAKNPIGISCPYADRVKERTDKTKIPKRKPPLFIDKPSFLL
jgi:hypothetical protein